MKTKPRLPRKYVNYGAIPKKKYQDSAGKPTIESLLSPTEGTGSEEKIITNQPPPNLPVKTWIQQLRQNRTGKQNPSGTSLGRRTNRTLRRNAGSDNRRW